MTGALAASFAIVAMLLTKTLDPPAGATALIAVIDGEKIHNLVGRTVLFCIFAKENPFFLILANGRPRLSL